MRATLHSNTLSLMSCEASLARCIPLPLPLWERRDLSGGPTHLDVGPFLLAESLELVHEHPLCSFGHFASPVRDAWVWAGVGVVLGGGAGSAGAEQSDVDAEDRLGGRVFIEGGGEGEKGRRRVQVREARAEAGFSSSRQKSWVSE